MNKENKRGPKPKELVEGHYLGLPVGRNNTVVPPDMVQELAALGCLDKEISNFFGIKDDTLRRNFADELTKGREEMKVKLRKAMFQNACSHMNAAVQIFLAKNLLNMSDNGLNANQEPLPWSDDDEPTAGQELADKLNDYEENNNEQGI